MAQARKAPKHRQNRRVSKGNGRGSVASSAARIDEVADLSSGERLDAKAVGEGVDDGQLDQPGQKYSRLRVKAEAALEMLLDTPSVPPNVRAAAIRTALELVGAIGAKAKGQQDQYDSDGELDPEMLTIEAIDREIAKLGR